MYLNILNVFDILLLLIFNKKKYDSYNKISAIQSIIVNSKKKKKIFIGPQKLNKNKFNFYLCCDR